MLRIVTQEGIHSVIGIDREGCTIHDGSRKLQLRQEPFEVPLDDHLFVVFIFELVDRPLGDRGSHEVMAQL